MYACTIALNNATPHFFSRPMGRRGNSVRWERFQKESAKHRHEYQSSTQWWLEHPWRQHYSWHTYLLAKPIYWSSLLSKTWTLGLSQKRDAQKPIAMAWKAKSPHCNRLKSKPNMCPLTCNDLVTWWALLYAYIVKIWTEELHTYILRILLLMIPSKLPYLVVLANFGAPRWVHIDWMMRARSFFHGDWSWEVWNNNASNSD
jgi:hypothetical protein